MATVFLLERNPEKLIECLGWLVEKTKKLRVAWLCNDHPSGSTKLMCKTSEPYEVKECLIEYGIPPACIFIDLE